MPKAPAPRRIKQLDVTSRRNRKIRKVVEEMQSAGIPLRQRRLLIEKMGLEKAQRHAEALAVALRIVNQGEKREVRRQGMQEGPLFKHAEIEKERFLEQCKFTLTEAKKMRLAEDKLDEIRQNLAVILTDCNNFETATARAKSFWNTYLNAK